MKKYVSLKIWSVLWMSKDMWTLSKYAKLEIDMHDCEVQKVTVVREQNLNLCKYNMIDQNDNMDDWIDNEWKLHWIDDNALEFCWQSVIWGESQLQSKYFAHVCNCRFKLLLKRLIVFRSQCLNPGLFSDQVKKLQFRF